MQFGILIISNNGETFLKICGYDKPIITQTLKKSCGVEGVHRSEPLSMVECNFYTSLNI